MRDFRHLFRNEQDEAAAESLERHREVLDWVQQSYHSRFENWLEKEASKPLNIAAQHMDLVQSAVRANAFKEVRQRLAKLRTDATDAMESARGEDDE